MIDDNDFICLIIYLLILNSYYTDIAIISLQILRTVANSQFNIITITIIIIIFLLNCIV